MPESGEAEFIMIFPPVASNAVFVDFGTKYIDEMWNPWRIWGIQLTKKSLKTALPKDFKAASIDKNAVLSPVEFKTGKARLEGWILNYRVGMPAEVKIKVAYPFDYPSEMTFLIDEKGKFSGEINAFAVHPVTVYWLEYDVQCFIASDETTSIILNPAEMSRRKSRLLGDKPSLGEPVYYGGYLASLSKELAETEYVLDYFHGYSYMSFLQLMETKTPETLKTFYLERYQIKKAELNTLDISPACKQILNCRTDLFYVSCIAFLDRSRVHL
jgi:hypothetical protein